MKKLSILLTAFISTLALVGVVSAGYKITVPVSVYSTSFTGAMGSARNSADSLQYLFCRDNGTNAFCGARDSAGTSKSCTTTNPAHLNIIRSMVGTSRLGISFSGGICTSMYQVNGSYYDALDH